jgi:hypothetical protein
MRRGVQIDRPSAVQRAEGPYQPAGKGSSPSVGIDEEFTHIPWSNSSTLRGKRISSDEQ